MFKVQSSSPLIFLASPRPCVSALKLYVIVIVLTLKRFIKVQGTCHGVNLQISNLNSVGLTLLFIL
ncbi:MAG: hypothetical protein A2075_06400 [Geobacteraceae bacterium GWC2_58_44]|nr:MAG: hypothetical protein A2075_06400 [Geobacteraceae bacterium GWC2_58_44]